MSYSGASLSLRPVIKVDEDRCVNCHTCIAVCPVKYCIDGSGDKVTINADLCIACGSCVAACTQHARSVLDDSDDFLAAIERHEPIIAVAAPALSASFGEQAPALMGWLQRMGVAAFFDVGFGAELTVATYLNHIDRNKPSLVIAQPCAAIVTYIETYRSGLLRHLAPADSPMLHTIKMIRAWYPAYANHRIAVLSPCAAKKREFDETGLGDWNVVMSSLARLVEERGVDLSREKPVGFMNPPAERGVVFSTPGGLLRTALRERPGIAAVARKIEGPELIYPYLDGLEASVSKGLNPLLVDCLNCAYGCNAGAGTPNVGKNPDEFEARVERRREALESRNKTKGLSPEKAAQRLKRVFSRFWKPGLYGRRYVDRSANFSVLRPDEAQLKKIYADMGKKVESDFLNCSSCGYRSCEGMAVAIHNGLNKRENCHLYRQILIEGEKAIVESSVHRLREEIERSRGMVERIKETISSLDDESRSQFASVEQSSAAVEEMIAMLSNASKVAASKREQLSRLSEAAAQGERGMAATVEAIRRVATSVSGIGEMTGVIHDVAERTNLLSMNAAIEAAHAGNSGKGFGVVAGEIRKLAEMTGGNAARISASLKAIIEQIQASDELTQRTGTGVRQVAENVASMAEEMSDLLNSLTEMASGGAQVVQGVESLRSVSMDVKSLYGRMSAEVGSILGELETLTRISEETRRGVASGEGA